MDCSNIQYHYMDTLSRPHLEQLITLFQKAAFWARDRTPEEMSIAITHSHPIVTAWDRDTLIGFARATSDGMYRATLWDVVVDPAYQGAGLGRKLVETVLSHPFMSRTERVYLMTTHQQEFYKRIGFQENQTTTMVLFHQEIEPIPTLLVPEPETRPGQIQVDG